MLDNSECVGTTKTIHYFYFGVVPMGCIQEEDTAELKLQMHRLFVVPQPPPRQQCPYCGLWAISRLNMVVHMHSRQCLDMPDPTTGIQSRQHLCMPVHVVHHDVVLALGKTPLPKTGPFDIVDVDSIPLRSEGLNKAVARVRHYEMGRLKPPGSKVINDIWYLATAKKQGKFFSRDDLPFLVVLPFLKPFNDWPTALQ